MSSSRLPPIRPEWFRVRLDSLTSAPVRLLRVRVLFYSGESRIEYIPFEQRITDYEVREWVEQIPRQRTVTEYQERRYTETVPREVTKVDYYAIEYLRQYIPQVIPETTVETVPVERIVQRTEYIPVER